MKLYKKLTTYKYLRWCAYTRREAFNTAFRVQRATLVDADELRRGRAK